MSDHEKNKEMNSAKDGVNQSRRKFARAGLIATPVIYTLSTKSALARNACTVSGQLSGNMSQNPNTDPCDQTGYQGLTPGYWGTHPKDWSNYGFACGSCTDGTSGPHCTYNSYKTDGTKFHNHDFRGFTGSIYGTYSMMEVIQFGGTDDHYQLGAHTCAALLNAHKFGKTGYGLSVDEVYTMWSTYYLTNPVELKEAFQYLNEKGGM